MKKVLTVILAVVLCCTLTTPVLALPTAGVLREASRPTTETRTKTVAKSNPNSGIFRILDGMMLQVQVELAKTEAQTEVKVGKKAEAKARTKAQVQAEMETDMEASEATTVPTKETEELVWVASGMRVDTSWLDTVGTWKERSETKGYFLSENTFDYQAFLEDHGASYVDFNIDKTKDGTKLMQLSYEKDRVQYYLLSEIEEGGKASFQMDAKGADGITYSAMSEESYWYYLQNAHKMQEAVVRNTTPTLIVDATDGGFCTNEEMFNDFVLVTLADSKMIYPESTDGEYIVKLCPFDGLIPHSCTNRAETVTGFSAKHTTLATIGTDWESWEGYVEDGEGLPQ